MIKPQKKRLGTGANNMEKYEVPKETTALQSNTKDGIVTQSNTKNGKSLLKISFRMKTSEQEYFTTSSTLNNSTISGEIHRALAEYMRKHPL